VSGSEIVERARVYARTEQWDKALVALGEAIELEPDSASAFEARARVYERLGRWEEAIADRSRRIDLSPEDAWPESRDAAHSRRPDLARAHRQRALAYAGKGDLARSMRDLDRGIALDPTCAEAWHARGVLWSKRGDAARAIADFTRAIELDATHRPALLHRAEAHASAGRAEEAAQDFRRALALDPLDEALAPYGPAPAPRDDTEWLDRALACAARARYPEAIEAFDRVVEAKDDPELQSAALLGRARARAASGDLAGAITDLDAYLIRSPDAFGHL
jgi:tetratricopeptide (TPR) repeat protein